jgi:hypothetical protein
MLLAQGSLQEVQRHHYYNILSINGCCVSCMTPSHEDSRIGIIYNKYAWAYTCNFPWHTIGAMRFLQAGWFVPSKGVILAAQYVIGEHIISRANSLQMFKILLICRLRETFSRNFTQRAQKSTGAATPPNIAELPSYRLHLDGIGELKVYMQL